MGIDEQKLREVQIRTEANNYVLEHGMSPNADWWIDKIKSLIPQRGIAECDSIEHIKCSSVDICRDEYGNIRSVRTIESLSNPVDTKEKWEVPTIKDVPPYASVGAAMASSMEYQIMQSKDPSPLPTKEIEWEKEFDKKFASADYDFLSDKKKLCSHIKDFIHSTLSAQRKELAGKVEELPIRIENDDNRKYVDLSKVLSLIKEEITMFYLRKHPLEIAKELDEAIRIVQKNDFIEFMELLKKEVKEEEGLQD